MHFGWVSWVNLAAVLCLILINIWAKKAGSGAQVLYGLAAIPGTLFLLNGILLRHLALVVAALVFATSHLWIVHENT